MAISQQPPFRADHVGSLLRPDSVKRARKAHYEEGTASAAELQAAEDAAIREAVAMQERIGLQAVTDGEIRAESPGMRIVSPASEVTAHDVHRRVAGAITGQRYNRVPVAVPCPGQDQVPG